MLEINNLCKSYENLKALKSVNLQIQEGEFFSILGPSGCGKSTLLRLLGGFEKPDEGEIKLDSVAIQFDAAFRRPFNTVFQNYALFPHLNVYDNVAFGLKIKGVPKQQVQKRVAETLELVQMSTCSERFPQALSGGQKQRVALARALINQPKVLLLDECLSALDLKLRKQMQIELLLLQKKLGITFIFVTHDQEEAMSMSNRIAIMHEGEIIQIGTPQEIYDHPKSIYVAKFIGEMNFYSPRNSKHIHAVRPEKMRINLNGTDNMPSVESNMKLRALVQEIIFKGSFYEVICETEQEGVASAQKLFSVVLATHSASENSMIQKLHPNQSVELCWNLKDCHIFDKPQNTSEQESEVETLF